MDVRTLTVLIVEDQEFQRRALVKMLKDLGVQEVYAAEDGRAALALLENLDKPVDIVVSDLAMPRMDGAEFIRQLALAGKSPSLVIASALEPELLASVEAMAVSHGFEVLDTIEKPITPYKMQRVIDRYRLKAPPAAS